MVFEPRGGVQGGGRQKKRKKQEGRVPGLMHRKKVGFSLVLKGFRRFLVQGELKNIDFSLVLEAFWCWGKSKKLVFHSF